MDMDPMPPADFYRVLLAWTWAPAWDAVVVLALIMYAVLVRRFNRTGTRWPIGSTVAAGAAVVALVVAFNSAVAVYAPALFWVHMLQHLMLIMVVPVLIVLSQPLRLWQSSTRSGPRSPGIRRAFGLVTTPLSTVPLYAAVLVGTHLTGFQQVMLDHMWVHELESVLYLISGYLLFGALVGADLWPWRVPHLVRFVVLGASMGIDALVGVVLMMTSHPIAPSYAAAHPGWGPGALADQGAAGAVMWFGGDGLMMILMIVTAVQWGRAGLRDQGAGAWLEGIRQRQLLGDCATDDQVGTDLDDDDRALRTYNLMLAGLHDGERRGLSAPVREAEST